MESLMLDIMYDLPDASRVRPTPSPTGSSAARSRCTGRKQRDCGMFSGRAFSLRIARSSQDVAGASWCGHFRGCGGPRTSSFRTSRTVQRKLRMEGQHAGSALNERAWQRQMNVIDVRIARVLWNRSIMPEGAITAGRQNVCSGHRRARKRFRTEKLPKQSQFGLSISRSSTIS